MQQTGSFSVPGKRKLYSENLWAQVIRPIGREGVVELHTAGEVWYLRSPSPTGIRPVEPYANSLLGDLSKPVVEQKIEVVWDLML